MDNPPTLWINLTRTNPRENPPLGQISVQHIPLPLFVLILAESVVYLQYGGMVLCSLRWRHCASRIRSHSRSGPPASNQQGRSRPARSSPWEVRWHRTGTPPPPQPLDWPTYPHRLTIFGDDSVPLRRAVIRFSAHDAYRDALRLFTGVDLVEPVAKWHSLSVCCWYHDTGWPKK